MNIEKSLESCPMCSVRLITSGVNKVLHAAHDMKGGMVRNMRNLHDISQRTHQPFNVLITAAFGHAKKHGISELRVPILE